MGKFTHYGDLIDQALFPVTLRIGSLLTESLDGIFLVILNIDCQINGCKVTSSKLFNRMKELMKTSLVQFGSKM
jgi:hypothetical protein